MKKSAFIKRLIITLLLLVAAGGMLHAANVTVPKIALSVNPAENPKDVAATIQIVLLLTVLTLAPAILMLMTSFTRIVIVLSFLRQALGSQQIPPNQILIGLALFMTFFLMRPVGTEIYDKAWKPYSENKITLDKAVDEAVKPVRQFMFKQTREKDLALFIYLSKSPRPKNPNDVPTTVLIPAFVISELKTAFTVGFIIYVPFLIIDMVVASTLMSMGMMMLPPVMISLPFKILLFILVDGWHLLSRALIVSF
ncbi:MAG: Flagellar biosynthetic protein FliP precursor [Candidatus Aerophobetes bacterium ADurb.Bin490]|nr:MAG: Flagellar biosynthetic protein FliP precursor [Candidatus Aerophobetes bacterium ADurb.Bin490]HNZ29151.1 flagellar type III secretion system pore protein FliP [Candidatus Goldiibacteriota bacterium]HPI03038.1 flagellar type III secretion system pore protein FliP [Candidatus Goldiibacteriota bacterium]HPN65420.1 flagellar type III secretion system pore protein FliP [Candidatus Goldiibacteriota bacterium]HRQ43913.1 flagellar type III secretion system pore protein FliP [Candidatus Goldiiba